MSAPAVILTKPLHDHRASLKGGVAVVGRWMGERVVFALFPMMQRTEVDFQNSLAEAQDYVRSKGAMGPHNVPKDGYEVVRYDAQGDVGAGQPAGCLGGG